MEILAAIYGGLALGDAVTSTFKNTVLKARETADIIKRADQKPGYNPGLSAAKKKKGTPASRTVGSAVAADPPGHYNTPKTFAARLISETGSKKAARAALSQSRKVWREKKMLFRSFNVARRILHT